MAGLDTPGAVASGALKLEKTTVKVGFLPLTDCASLVMASVLGLDEKHGIKIVLSREASWSAIRDQLCSGELDAAHALYGMVMSVQMGIGAQQHPMAVLMSLSQNGQAITLSRELVTRGAVDGPSLALLMKREQRQLTFAQTFPTGNHAMWLYYWLASVGIDPYRDARVVTVPPSQMVANLKAGHINGFCAGEPWGHRALADGVGITATTSQQIWPEHPGKVLAASARFVDAHPNTSRALVAAVLEASRWIEASQVNKQAMTEAISSPAYVNTSADVIGPRILGQYHDGLGNQWVDSHCLKFYDEGAVNFPYLSDAMWFMTQHRRWGLLKEDPDYLAVATGVNRIGLYREAAELTGTPLPAGVMRASTLIDAKVWDGSDPAGYAASFAISRR
ncbi:MAG: CmpA/NrtA family ABC transporter substrate-binding protein [Massilia sp.]